MGRTSCDHGPKSIQQFKDRPDWQSILDGGKKDDWISHKNADAFWNMAGNPKDMNEEFPVISPTEQGGIGDCYFMAALTAVGNSPSGKLKIGNMIQPVWSDNNRHVLGYGYLVKFPGDPLNKTYQMTKGEVDDGNQFSSGDHTTRVLEVVIASQKVTYCNPWDSRKQETVPLETFLDRSDGITYVGEDASPNTSSLPT